MAVSVLTSHVFGPAKLIFNAGGLGPAKFNVPTDPFAKYMHIYIYIYIHIIHGLTLLAMPKIGNCQIQYHIQPFYTFPTANSMPIRPPID